MKDSVLCAPDHFDLDLVVKAAVAAGMSQETIYRLIGLGDTDAESAKFLVFAVGNWTSGIGQTRHAH